MVVSIKSAIGSVNQKFPCREDQILRLSYLLAPDRPSPASVVVYGLPATGKTLVTKRVLEESETTHAVVSCAECITSRHLFERIVAICLREAAVSVATVNDKALARCESLNALSGHLQTILSGLDKFVLVLDGVDAQRDSPATLLQALARLGEIIPSLTVVLILTTPSPRLLHSSCVPHIHFPSYTGLEMVHILSQDPLPLPDADFEVGKAELALLYSRYLTALSSSLSGGTPDIVAFKRLASESWPTFTAHIIDGSIDMKDFSKLVLANRSLFQSEEPLIARLAPTQPDASGQTHSAVYELPYYSKYLLCAAYLASYNPARTDPTFFMRHTEKRRRKKAHGASLGRPPKNRKIPRRLLAPSPFALERMLAIFHSIVPDRVIATADLGTQIATLVSLRLLARSGLGSGDGLDSSSRLKVNVAEDFVVSLARSVNFEISELFAEA